MEVTVDYYYVLNNVFKLEYLQIIFSDMLEKSDRFSIHFPGDQIEFNSEDERERGKEEFVSLEGTEIKKSPFFKNGIVVSGETNIDSKKLFYFYYSKAHLEGANKGLYQFELYSEGKKVFEIQNFKIGYILCSFYESDEREKLGLSLYEPFIL